MEIRKSGILRAITVLITIYSLYFLTYAQYASGSGELNNPSPADGSMHPDTWVNLCWPSVDTTLSYDIYFGENYNDLEAGTGGTFQRNQIDNFFIVGFTGFPYPDGLVLGTTYYWRIDKVSDTEPNSPQEGPVWSFSILPRTAYNPDPADYAEAVELDAKLSWTPGFDAKLHTVYFGDNFDDVNNATGGLPQGFTTCYPGTLMMAKKYYWRVDEFDGIDTYKGGVWSFITQGAVGNPEPANGVMDVIQTPILTWTPGIYADSHLIYFGTDAEAVKNADTDSPEYKGKGNLGSENYDPGKLSLNTAYYWRIDEGNNTNPDSPWTGPVWSFTTANFLIVDDFESYNDLDEGEPGSNRIYLTWVDGYDNPAINGSVVGFTGMRWWPPKVHSGLQSMPFDYDNGVGKSEATANIDNLAIGRDWSIKGVDILSLWFHGHLRNDAEPMYVALADDNGTTGVSYHDNPDAAQIEKWTEWTIDLLKFKDQGVNLTDIRTITLGLGNRNNPVAGSSGKLWFDDIRLYLPPWPY